MRVAVVDIGTNSTRLLVAEVNGGRVKEELARESIVTRLGQGVDATGTLATEAMERVFDVLTQYRATIDDLQAERTMAVLTSAVRDASNGDHFKQTVKERFGLDARTLSGDEEAALTFTGATSERAPQDDPRGEIVVIDIGGGSTELVIGNSAGEVSFHTSLQAGVVRMTERHLHHDPPLADEVQHLIHDVRRIIDAGLPLEVRKRVDGAVAVAGTATMAAAMDLELEPYDPNRVHGHTVTVETLENLRNRLATMTNDQRKQVKGLHPDRAPTIVAGMAMLRECVGAFWLDAAEVSEHDILRGGALQRAAEPV